MKVSDVFVHSRAIWRRVSQVMFVLFCLGLSALAMTASFDSRTRYILAATAVLFGVTILLLWEIRIMRQYGLSIFPPGSGTFRTHKDQRVGRFLSLIELISRFRWSSGGILVGRPLPQHRLFGLFRGLRVGPVDDRHMLTVAGARSGKGTAALIPNLLLYPGSALVVDPKGELAQITAARRGQGSQQVSRSLKQSVYILDPEDIVVGHTKARWNPLAELEMSDPHLWGKAARIGLALVPIRSEKGGDEFFTNQARDLLTALIVHVLTTEPSERHNLIYVRRLITQGDMEVFTMVEEECDQSGTELPLSDPLQAMLSYMKTNTVQAGKVSRVAQSILALADETKAGVIGTLVEQTGFLDHYSMETLLQSSDFTLADLKTRPTTVYICLKGTSLAGPLAKIVFLLIDLAITRMEEIPGKPPHNVLFAIDEFYCLGRSEAIDRAMGLIAGFGLTLWPVLQHIGQLQKHYPDTWDNFIRNCRAVQYFGDLAPDLLRELESRLGQRVVRKKGGTDEYVPLLPFTELSSNYFTRESRRQLVFFQQQPAAALELVDHYKLFSKEMYEDDPRAKDRSQYVAWTTP